MSPEGPEPVVADLLTPTCAIHPDRPSAGPCDHCGTFACGTCLGWLGGRKICVTCRDEGRVNVYGIPWDQRGEIGTLSAWGRTASLVYTQPGQFFRNLDPTGPLGEAVLFALISAAWPALLYLVLMTVIGALLAVAAAVGSLPFDPGVAAVIAVVGVFYVVFPPLLMVLGSFFWALAHHVVLLLTGGAPAASERPRGW